MVIRTCKSLSPRCLPSTETACSIILPCVLLLSGLVETWSQESLWDEVANGCIQDHGELKDDCSASEREEILMQVSLLQAGLQHRQKGVDEWQAFDPARVLGAWVKCAGSAKCMDASQSKDSKKFQASHINAGPDEGIVAPANAAEADASEWASSRQGELVEKWRVFSLLRPSSDFGKDEFLNFVRTDFRLHRICNRLPAACGKVSHSFLSTQPRDEKELMAGGLIKEETSLNANAEMEEPSTTCQVIDGTSLGNMPPKQIDWLERGMMTEVLNQSPCQTCWSFAGASTIASQIAILTGKPPRQLDNQAMVNCINNGYCKVAKPGGVLSSPFDYVLGKCGVWLEDVGEVANASMQCGGWACPYQPDVAKDYYEYLRKLDKHDKFGDGNFYTGWLKRTIPKEESRCTPSCKQEELHFPGCQLINDGEPGLLHAVAKGPVSTGICFPEVLWYWNSTEIFGLDQDSRDACNDCGFMGTNHAVVVAGYGKEGGHDYWLIKNSYGLEWGMQSPLQYRGYFKLARGLNACNLAGGLVPRMRAARLAL
eukprot:TRINITY_DN36979_c0_g2_i1.p1 TRINITY_DN36979_c0_g2~~TRINITY_DN36979_c0_g2_i1.p1  ORF type:complete len:554 (+),score=117.67 TRINITY_DN36979_c0_g2_i1:41-1663(+)